MPRASWAFSDSVNDLPLLSLVRHPVAVNPDRDLAAIALTNGWRILRKWDAGRGFARRPVGCPTRSPY